MWSKEKPKGPRGQNSKLMNEKPLKIRSERNVPTAREENLADGTCIMHICCHSFVVPLYGKVIINL